MKESHPPLKAGGTFPLRNYPMVDGYAPNPCEGLAKMRDPLLVEKKLILGDGFIRFLHIEVGTLQVNMSNYPQELIIFIYYWLIFQGICINFIF